MTTTTTLAELPGLVGTELGTSDWVEVTQERVNLFADATDDHQWIHIDVDRAKRESPFGGPIAHGYLTLSMLVPLVAQVLTITDTRMGVNYGLNKVRFPAPVPVGSKVRARVTLKDVEQVAGGLQNTLVVTDTAMAVNYGLNKVRFPSHVPVGSKVRLTATLKDVEECPGGLQLTFSCAIGREDESTPVCVAEPVYRYYAG